MSSALFDEYYAAALGLTPLNIYTNAERDGCERVYSESLNLPNILLPLPTLPRTKLPVNILMWTHNLFRCANTSRTVPWE